MVVLELPPDSSRRRHKCHFERGAAAVEMALVMPLLILMVMGIIDFGRIFNAEIQLSQAAREGARVAALGFSEDQVIARTKAALNNPAFQGSTGLIISVSVVNGSGVVQTTGRTDPYVYVCNPADPTDVDSYYGQVTVSIPYTKILFGPESLSQKAVMKCSG